MAEGDGAWTEYAGGYSDMVAQRGLGVEARRAKMETEKSTTVISKATSQPKRKLSFKEKHALETLPGIMDKLHKDIARLETTLADASLFRRDPKGFDKTITSLAKARDDMAKAEEQWLDLEMKREELEGA